MSLMVVNDGRGQDDEPKFVPSISKRRVVLLTTDTASMRGFAKVIFRGLDMSAPALPVAVNVNSSVYSHGFTLRVTAVLFNHVTVGVNTPANVENNAEVSTPPPK